MSAPLLSSSLAQRVHGVLALAVGLQYATGAQRLERAQWWATFFWAMAPIALKYAARGSTRQGASQADLRVFQPFFVDLDLPVAMIRGDEVAVPVVVYNYLDTPQTVQLRLPDCGHSPQRDQPERTLEAVTAFLQPLP